MADDDGAPVRGRVKVDLDAVGQGLDGPSVFTAIVEQIKDLDRNGTLSIHFVSTKLEEPEHSLAAIFLALCMMRATLSRFEFRAFVPTGICQFSLDFLVWFLSNILGPDEEPLTMFEQLQNLPSPAPRQHRRLWWWQRG